MEKINNCLNQQKSCRSEWYREDNSELLEMNQENLLSQLWYKVDFWFYKISI